MFLPLPKATVLVASGPDNDPDRKHLFVLMTHGLGQDEEVLLVSINSVVAGVPHDQSCVLNPGDHPFVRHASCARYDKPRKVNRQKIADAVKSGVFIAHDPVSQDVYDRLCAGLLASPYASPATKDFLRWHLDLCD